MRRDWPLSFKISFTAWLLCGPFVGLLIAKDSDQDKCEVVVEARDNSGKPRTDITARLFDFESTWRVRRLIEREAQGGPQGLIRWSGLEPNSYLVIAKTADGLAGIHQCLLTSDNANQKAVIALSPARPTVVLLKDELGKPITGATIRSLLLTGPNGESRFGWPSLAVCGLVSSPSDAKGLLTLPDLPEGTLKVTIGHPDFAPVQIEEVQSGQSVPTSAVMEVGVPLTFEFEKVPDRPMVESLLIDLRYDPFEALSTFIDKLPDLRSNGIGHLTVAAGPCDWVRFTHPDYQIIPTYASINGKTLADTEEPMQIRRGADRFRFQILPKVKARGRVIDEATGKPIASQTVQGEMYSKISDGPFARFASKWSHVDWGNTDAEGRFELLLAAGKARITYRSKGMLANPSATEVEVAADGSTVIPDILVRPIPKVRGVVLDDAGAPIERAVVRFRDSILAYADSISSTDEQGRFELSPPWIPTDLQTDEARPLQTVVAFHPSKPLADQVQVRLDQPESLDRVELRLKPSDPRSLVGGFAAELTPFQRGIVSKEQQQRQRDSLVGKPAPDLDGLVWLNTAKPTMALADFRGKYVLLQFWTTWCGPCHGDLPTIKLAYDLYRDKDFVVIGVHNNSMPIDAIEADAKKNDMRYPIVVDHPDGRILKAYEKQVDGYPSYLLIGPDGKVIQDDLAPVPTLRSHTIEIVRSNILENSKKE